MYTVLDPLVENNIIYIPVAPDTEGGTPKLKSKGLNIAPPPNPSAPDTHPPRKAKTINFRRICFVRMTSLGAIPKPTLIFKAWVFITLVMENIVIAVQNTIKVISITQSV